MYSTCIWILQILNLLLSEWMDTVGDRVCLSVGLRVIYEASAQKDKEKSLTLLLYETRSILEYYTWVKKKKQRILISQQVTTVVTQNYDARSWITCRYLLYWYVIHRADLKLSHAVHSFDSVLWNDPMCIIQSHCFTSTSCWYCAHTNEAEIHVWAVAHLPINTEFPTLCPISGKIHFCNVSSLANPPNNMNTLLRC